MCGLRLTVFCTLVEKEALWDFRGLSSVSVSKPKRINPLRSYRTEKDGYLYSFPNLVATNRCQQGKSPDQLNFHPRKMRGVYHKVCK